MSNRLFSDEVLATMEREEFGRGSADDTESALDERIEIAARMREMWGIEEGE